MHLFSELSHYVTIASGFNKLKVSDSQVHFK